MNKLSLLKNISVGNRIAEDEIDNLQNYFVKTDQWDNISKGNVDIIYGPKGSGKSALYLLLTQNKNEFKKENIIIESAENVRGAPVFKGLIIDPPPSETSFIFLWKIYIIFLLLNISKENSITIPKVNILYKNLEKLKIIPKQISIKNLFQAAQNLLKQFINNDETAFTFSLEIDKFTGNATYSTKIDFSKINLEDKLSKVSIDDSLNILNSGIISSKNTIWILFDRLDVAFVENRNIEKNALRALFRVYNDLKPYKGILLKIFVRDDIWQRILEGGFSEASHITKSTNILWSTNGIINLIISRLINNEAFLEYYNINKEDILENFNKQKALLNKIFPNQIDIGNNPKTIDWIITRTYDSTKRFSPREIIHLIDEARIIQIQKLERGEKEPSKNVLINNLSFKEALNNVSKAKYEQTLLAEYYEYKDYIEKLFKEKTELSLNRLMQIWGTDKKETLRIGNYLKNIGLFEEKGDKSNPTYWVPFIYRFALNMVRGKSE